MTAKDEEALVGSHLPTLQRAPWSRSQADAPAVLVVDRVSTRLDPEGPALSDVSLAIAPGEIVGVAGVEGNGQRTLVRALAGLVDIRSGRIRLGGQDVATCPLASGGRADLRVIPFERNSEGLSLSSSLWENWSARQLLRGSALRLIIASADFARVRQGIEAMGRPLFHHPPGGGLPLGRQRAKANPCARGRR